MTRTKMNRTKEIMEILKNADGLLSSNQVAKKLGIHVNTVQWGLEELFLQGLVKKILTSNGTFWEINKAGGSDD